MFSKYKQLKAEYDKLQEKYDELLENQAKIDSQFVLESSSIDSFWIAFDKINVFSIERLPNNKTIIGWIDSSEKTHEWHFSCSHEVHLEIVKEFKNSLKGK